MSRNNEKSNFVYKRKLPIADYKVIESEEDDDVLNSNEIRKWNINEKLSDSNKYSYECVKFICAKGKLTFTTATTKIGTKPLNDYRFFFELPCSRTQSHRGSNHQFIEKGNNL